MSPVALRRVQLRLFKNAAFPHLFALPATGATVEFFRRSAVATAAVEVHEMDTVTVPVADGSGFQAGDPVTALGGPDRDFQVRSVAANSLELDYLGTNNFVLAIGDRIRSFQPLDVHLGEGTAIPPTSSLTVDASGIAQGYLEPERFDYEVLRASDLSAFEQ